MFVDLFRRDLQTCVYGERGLGTDRDLRMRALDEVRRIFDSERANLLVSKPLVESQHALELLAEFPESKAVWMFRNYVDVVRSATRLFGRESALDNLRGIVDPAAKQTFSAENIDSRTRDIVAQNFSESMSTENAQALFWYVRNNIYFQRELDRNERVKLVEYESFVAQPAASLRDVYSFIGCEYPGDQLVADVHSRSVRAQPSQLINKSLADLCEALLYRLKARASRIAGGACA
jgi:hypothetical protein